MSLKTEEKVDAKNGAIEEDNELPLVFNTESKISATTFKIEDDNEFPVSSKPVSPTTTSTPE